MKQNQGKDHGMMGAVYIITLQGGPYHAETRRVPEPPPYRDSGCGINALAPSYYYCFHKTDGDWQPTAIYIQDPSNRSLFHFLADATPN